MNSISAIGDETLAQIIACTQKRLLFVAPGISERVANVIAVVWKRLPPDSVTVVLDVDPEVCRLGYGTIEGLGILQETANTVGAVLCQERGVRIGLLVSDETTAIYSPTPLLIEHSVDEDPKSAPNNQSEAELFSRRTGGIRPNGIILKSLPSEVAKDVGWGERGSEDQTVGLDQVSTQKVEEVKAGLQENPPARFDIARRIRVFTQRFQYVEFSLQDCFISKKTVNIPNELLGLLRDDGARRQLEDRIKTNFNLISKADLKFKVMLPGSKDKTEISEDVLRKAKAAISKRFLTNLPNYGSVILKTNQSAFLKEVGTLKTLITEFQNAVGTNVQGIIDANRKSVVEWLIPTVTANPPAELTKIHGPRLSERTVKKFLNDKLQRVFGTANELVADMNVSVVFKDVTWESLNDPKFIETAKKAMPTLESLFDEFEAVKSNNPHPRISPPA